MQELSFELWIPSLVMVALFVRQAMLFTSPKLINYSPIILSLAVISAVLHMMLLPITSINDFFVRLQTSLIPVLLGLFLYMMSNIVHQAKKKMAKNDAEELRGVLVRLISEIKEYFSQLDIGLHSLIEKTHDTSKELEQSFREEFSVLRHLGENQKIFLKNFEEMKVKQAKAIDQMDHYIKEQSVEVDNVIHKHLDLLRVSEQEHYNSIYTMLQSHMDEAKHKTIVEEQLIALQEQTEKLSSLLQMSANTIVQNTQSFFDDWFDDFKNRFEIMQRSLVSVANGTKSYEEAITANHKALYALQESIVGTSKSMDVLQKKTVELQPIYDSMNSTALKLLTVAGEYEGIEKKFEELIQDLTTAQKDELRRMYAQVDNVAQRGVEHIKDSLELLHTHFGISTKVVNEKLQAVSKKGKLENTYGVSE